MNVAPVSLRIRHTGLLFAVCLAAFFWKLGAPGIFDLDEGLYVAAAREMLLRGDFVTPTVRGEPFFEKPPLAYWCSAASMALFGRSEWAARLPAAFAASLLVWIAAVFGRRLYGDRAGLFAGLILALTPLELGAARMLTTDALLCLSIGLSHYAAWRAMEATGRGALGWPMLFWVSIGAGLLAKGLPALVFPIMTTCTYVLWTYWGRWHEALRRLLRLRPALGILLCLGVAAPWHYLAYKANGEAFWAEYVVRQHLQRFRGGDTSHLAPFWFYVPVFLLGFFPWSVFLPGALRRHATRKSEGAPHRFLLLWAGIVFTAFSASGSKLVSYILPMMAPTAIFLGGWLAQRETEETGGRSLARPLLVVFASALVLSLFLLFLPQILEAASARAGRRLDAETIPDGALSAGRWMLACLCAGSAGAVWMAWNGRRSASVGILVAAMTAFTLLAAVRLAPALDAAYMRPLHDLAREAGREVARQGRILINVGPPRRPSVLFYLPDRLFVPGGQGDLAESADEEAANAFLHANPSGVVLTTAARGRALRVKDTRIRVEERSSWALVRYGPNTAAENR